MFSMGDGRLTMRRLVRLLVLGAAAVWLGGCDTGTDASMEVSGSYEDGIPAKEINDYTPTDKSYCVGQKILPQFAEYDYQCEAAEGKGECVQMPNPHLGNAFYCTLCGLKGTKMVCVLTNPE
jgi:hypothetical protein